MKNLILLLLTMMALAGCKDSQDKTVQSHDRLELIPEPDKAERLKYEAEQKLKKKDYTLTITKGVAIKENNRTFWVIPITLINKSKDTLNYFSMSCSWQDFYSIDNSKLQIEIAECDKNVPTILTLPPGKSRTEKIRLFTNQNTNLSGEKLKLGFNLIKPTAFQKASNFNKENDNGVILWSNTITL